MNVRSWVVAVLCCATIGCGRRTREDDAFHWEEPLPAGATIHIRNTDGGIEVSSTNDDVVRVTGSTRWSHGRGDAVGYLWTRHGRDVYVCAVWGRNGKCDATGYRSTRPGRSWLDMFSLFRRRSDAVANITVEVPPGIRVDASTVTGGVQVEGATAGVIATTTNGGISIESSAGPMVARSTNGSVKVSLDSLGDQDELRLETVNGSVVAELPGDVDGQVRLTTVNGRARSDFDLDGGDTRSSTRSIQGRIGNSSREIVLRSTNGSVSLRKHDASDSEPKEPAVSEPARPREPTPPTPPARPRRRA